MASSTSIHHQLVNQSIDTKFGEIQFGSLLGSGAFGSVYASRFRNQNLAMKIVECRNDNDLFRYLREKICLERLRYARHKNVVRVLGATTCGELGIFMFALAPQGSLDGYLKKHGPLAVAHAWKLFEQMLEGLAYLHVMGIFHRDVKPANVLLVDPLHCQLTDFGIAHCGTPFLHMIPAFSAQQKCGSDSFLPPEFFDIGSYLADAGDLWAAVITFIYMVTKRAPWLKASKVNDAEFKLFAEKNLRHLFPRWAPLQSAGKLSETLAMLEPVYRKRKYPTRYLQALQKLGVDPI